MLTATGQTDRLTPVMRAHEQRLGRPLHEALAEAYRTRTLAEIAADFGVTEGAISKWFKRLGIPTSHRKGVVHDSDGTPAARACGESMKTEARPTLPGVEGAGSATKG